MSQQQRTQWALDLFGEFVRDWVGPAARSAYVATALAGTSPSPFERVADAISAIAPTPDNSRRVGWAVFKREYDTEYSRERPSGWVHTMVSAVFEEPEQATNALAFLRAKHLTNNFVICEIQEIP
jgi:hypothetical protein